jgi:chromosome segregation ATPase
MEDVVNEDVQADIDDTNAVQEGAELPAADEVVDSSNVEVESQEVESQEQPIDEKIEVPKTEFEKLQAQVAQQEEFIQRRNNEVGSLRQQIIALERQEQALTKSEDEINELYLDNPAKAIQEQQELSRIQDQRRYIQELETKASLLQSDPQFEEKVGEIAELMVQDGYDPASVQKFKTNPYWVDSNVTRTYVAKVAQNRELADLRGKVESLTKKPQDVARKIEAAANSGVTLNASSSGTTGGEVVVTSETVESMTSEQRKHFIKTGEVLIN